MYSAGSFKPVMLMYCVSVCITTSGTRKHLNGTTASTVDNLLNVACTTLVQILLADVDAVLRSSSASKSLIMYQLPSISTSSSVIKTPIVILSAVPSHTLQL
jgi:hypothetical protein